MERYRIQPGAAVYFVTFSVVDWLPVFVSEAACRIVTDSLNFCFQQKGLCTNAFVIMPTHLHLILFHRTFDARQLSTSMADLRKFTGRSLSEFCARHMPKSFSEAFRRAATVDRSRRIWQPSRHPETIETEPFWKQKLDYLHDNPRRKGLVSHPDHWRFSSSAYYSSGGRVASDVSIQPIDWS